MTRPTVIVLFERLFAATLLIGLINSARLWPQLTAATPPTTLLAVQAATFMATLLLVVLVARRRSRAAAIILAAAFLIGLPVAVGQIGVLASDMTSAAILVLQFLLQLAALAMLLTPAGRAWLTRDGTS